MKVMAAGLKGGTSFMEDYTYHLSPGHNLVLGAHMLGPDAGEMMQLLGVAMKMGARKADLDATLAVHPTAAEEWVTLRTPARRHNT